MNNKSLMSMNVVTYILSIISGFTTWQGLKAVLVQSDSGITRDFLPAFAAIAIVIVQCIVWPYLFRYYSFANTTERGKVMKLVLPGFVLVIFLASTIWSVIGLGGESALLYHMSNTAQEADKTLNQLTKKVETDYSIRNTLATYSKHFANLSRSEAEGAISGYRGSSEVVRQLKVLSEALENVVDVVDVNYVDRQKEVTAVTDKITRMKSISEDASIKIADKQIQFSKMLTDLNQSFQKIKNRDLLVLIGDISKNLDVISAMTPPQGSDPLAIAQRSALERVKSTVTEIKSAINRQVEDLRVYSNLELPELKNINVSMAVIYNAVSIAPQIGIALALDYFPALLLVLLFVTAEARQRYDDEEQRVMLEDEQRKQKGIVLANKEKKKAEDKLVSVMQKAKKGVRSALKEKKMTVRSGVRKLKKHVDPKGKLVTVEAEDTTTKLARKPIPTNGHGTK